MIEKTGFIDTKTGYGDGIDTSGGLIRQATADLIDTTGGF